MKSKSTIIIIVAIILIVIITILTIFDVLNNNFDKDFSERLIVSEKLENKMKHYNCDIKHNDDEKFNDKGFFYSYKSTGESCPFEITYIAASNEETIDNISQTFLETMQSTNHIINNKEYYGVKSATIESDDYKIVIYNKVCVLYLKTNINNKEKAYDLLDELGYKSKMYN